MSSLIGKYQNGNYKVAIFNDGSKIRWNDKSFFDAEYPESIDVKICNKCTGTNCAACHEKSGPDGKLGDLNNPILNSLRPYTELAVGGGNPLEHPGLEDFLQRMHDQQVICNLTVHLNHFLLNYDKLSDYTYRGLVKGIGISVNRPLHSEEIRQINTFEHAVVHTIAGVTTEETFRSMFDHDLKLLILGYKNWGRGVDYLKRNVDVPYKIFTLEHMLRNDMKEHFKLISFDNLATAQLHVRDMVDDKTWRERYMGDDGCFTMYLDLVENAYAVSSTSSRIPLDGATNIVEVFGKVKERAL